MRNTDLTREQRNNPVYLAFKNSYGLDGTSLASYYNPHRTAFNNRFNKMELPTLKLTKRRKENEFDELFLLQAFWGYFIGIGVSSGISSTIFYLIINLVLFWVVMFIEIWFPSWTILGVMLRRTWFYAFMMAILTFYMAGNQIHVVFKTILDDIEIAKLRERTEMFERRVASTLASYIRFNLVAAFAVRWFYENGYIKVTGDQSDNPWIWVRLAFENMVNMRTISDFASYAGYETLSFKPINSFSSIRGFLAFILLGGIFLFNICFALAGFRALWKMKGSGWYNGLRRFLFRSPPTS
jgi:hypothetical protein